MGEYRASTLKSTLAVVRNSSTAREALASVSPAIIAAIETSSRTGWLPATYGVAINRAVLQHGGPGLVVSVNRDLTKASVEMPLFRPLIQGAITLFGGGPKGLVTSFAGAVKLATREVGTPTVDKTVGPRAARVTWSGLPPELQNDAWSWTVTGSLAGIFDIVGVEGRCVPDQSRLSEGVEVFDLDWE